MRAVWSIAFIQCIIAAAFVQIATSENVTNVADVNEFTPRNDPVSVFASPEGLCPSHSCANAWNSDRNCRCDSICEYYGDCCWDAVNKTEEVLPSLLPRELFQCLPLPGLATEIGVNEPPTGYFMVSICPEESNKDLKRKCEEEHDGKAYVMAESFLPVKDESGIFYKNIYCARCNGIKESNISIWEVSYECSACQVSLDLRLSYKAQLSSEDCELIADLPWVFVRSCFKELVESCPHEFNDSDIITKCQKYLAPGFWNFEWYKNPHCAICNGLVHYQDYVCSSFPEFDYYSYDIIPIHEDLFGGPWTLRGPSFNEPAIDVEKEDHKPIRRLSQCTRLYPQHLYLTIKIPNHRLHSHSCPYFGKRLEKCVNNQLHRLLRNDIQLPWKQIVNLPNEDPFSPTSTLLYYIPSSLTTEPYWESLLAEIYDFLLLSKEDCDFQDLFFLRVCGNLLSPEEVLRPCDNLLDTNTSDILARVSKNGVTELLNPLTNKTVKHVSWFAFEASINGSKMQSYKSQICQAKERSGQTTVETDVYELGGELKSAETSNSTRNRLPPVEQIFSNICISSSIICLLFTFITDCLFSELRNSFGITLMNFVSAFAVGQFLIHFVTDYVTQWPLVCTAVAIATHFVWLATFAGMNLLAWNLNSRFGAKKIRAVNYTSRKTMLAYFCYGWVLPFCIVSTCCIMFFVSRDTIPITYGLIEGVTCWIGNGWIVFAVVIDPLALAIIVNGVLFSLIVRGIRRNRFRPDNMNGRSGNIREKITELLIYIKISLLMGFVWVLGFVISFDKSRILWYTYYALQALQGISIMLVFAFNRRVRSMWRSKLLNLLNLSYTRG